MSTFSHVTKRAACLMLVHTHTARWSLKACCWPRSFAGWQQVSDTRNNLETALGPAAHEVPIHHYKLSVNCPGNWRWRRFWQEAPGGRQRKWSKDYSDPVPVHVDVCACMCAHVCACTLLNHGATYDPCTGHSARLHHGFFHHVTVSSGGNFDSDLEESFKGGSICDHGLVLSQDNKVSTLGHNHNNENLYITQASKHSFWNTPLRSRLLLQRFYLFFSWLTITLLYCDYYAFFTNRFWLCVEPQRKCHLWHSLHHFKLFQILHNILHIFIDF